MLRICLTIAAAVVVASSPASAAENPTAVPAKAKSAAEAKYCIAYDDTTGSRIRHQKCQTKQQWKREGVDLDRDLRA